MTKKFWLTFVLNEALSVLSAFGALKDPNLSTEINNAVAAIEALIAKL